MVRHSHTTLDPFHRAPLIGACAFALLALFAPPARGDVLKLAELERRALEHRPALEAEQARIQQANARVSLARSTLYPTLGAGAGLELAPGGRLIRVRDTNGDEYFVQGSREFGSDGVLVPAVRYNASLSLNGRIYDFGRTEAASGAAGANLGAAQAAARAQRLTIVQEVRSAYLSWLLAHGAREIARERARDTTELRQSVEGRVAEGTRPTSTIAQARYDDARAALDLSRSEADLSHARLALEQAIAAELDPAAEPDYSILNLHPTDSTTPEQPQVVALERQRDAALATARAQARATSPVLAGSADAGLAGQTGHLFPVYRLGVSLSVPLLDGGAASASAALARAQAEELASLAREARTNAGLIRRAARADLQRSEDRLRLAEALTSAADQALRDAEAQHALGAAPPESVVEARLRAAQAKLESLNARVARTQAALQLEGIDGPNDSGTSRSKAPAAR